MSASLASKVRTSILALQGRQILLLVLGLGVGIVLARKLDPAVFGLYAIATFCLSIVTMASDFGLAGSLVQRKQEIGSHEISVAFTVQLLVAIGAGTILWFAAPLALLVYGNEHPELVWIVRSLVPAILLSPILTSAKVQLERDIQFEKIARIDIAGAVVGHIVVLSCVYSGMGVWSFVASNLAGTAAAAAISWSMIRIHPRFRFDRALTRELFSFGVFFQFGNITNEAAGWIIPLISGAHLGPAAVGLLTWASSNGRRPLMIVDNVMRVAFPHFSRLQDEPVELARQVGLYLHRLLVVCFLWLMLAWNLAAPMTEIVYTSKWLPGVLSLQVFASALAFDVANWVGGMTLTAIGGVRATARWTLVKSLMAIGLAFLLVKSFGLVGIPLASAIASLVSGAGIFLELRRKVPIAVLPHALSALPFILAAMAVDAAAFAFPSSRNLVAWAVSILVGSLSAVHLLREFGLLRKWVGTGRP